MVELYTIALESGVSIIMRKRANIMSLAVIQLILHILLTMYTVFMSQLQYILRHYCPFRTLPLILCFNCRAILGHLVADQQVASTTSS